MGRLVCRRAASGTLVYSLDAANRRRWKCSCVVVSDASSCAQIRKKTETVLLLRGAVALGAGELTVSRFAAKPLLAAKAGMMRRRRKLIMRMRDCIVFVVLAPQLGLSELAIRGRR